VAEGAYSNDDARTLDQLIEQQKKASGDERKQLKRSVEELKNRRRTEMLATSLSEMTGLESRVTILGHVQRGGTPSPADRLLATRLGTACATYIAEGIHGVMVAARGDRTEPVPLDQVAGLTKSVPLDHPWLESARHLGIALGD
jgi:ATP-dependent phosphofructokinase / diphosphate-dependent phosphofructokinase